LWNQDLARASSSPKTSGLRGYDAVHLATALELDDENVAFVTWDSNLRRAAENSGLGVTGD